MNVKLAIALNSDSANSYPDNMEIEISSKDECMEICLENPHRRVSFKKSEFYKIMGVLSSIGSH